MKKRIKKALIIFGSVIAGIFLLLCLTLTPTRRVQLAALLTGYDSLKSVEYILDDESVSLAAEYMANGGKLSMDLVIEEAPLINGVSAELDIGTKGQESVSQLRIGRYLSFDAYSDNKELLVNLPVVDRGVKFPLTDSRTQPEDNENSGEEIGNATVKQLIAMIGAAATIKSHKREFVKWCSSLEFEKAGKEQVRIGDKYKNASVYTIHMNEESWSGLKEIIAAKYGSRHQIDEVFCECDLRLMVRNFKLRKAELIRADGSSSVIEFAGKKNAAYDIKLYSNGEESAAVQRLHTGGKEKTELLKLGNRELLNFSYTGSAAKLRAKYAGQNIRLSAGDIHSGSGASIDGIELEINDNIKANGNLRIFPGAETDMAFEKKTEYHDITVAGEKVKAAWEKIAGVIKSIKFISN